MTYDIPPTPLILFIKMLGECSHVVRVFSWEHRQTDQVDMLYMLMDIGDTDLSKILNAHRKNKTLSINKIRFFWEEMLLVKRNSRYIFVN